jgi:hypothetical protein
MATGLEAPLPENIRTQGCRDWRRLGAQIEKRPIIIKPPAFYERINLFPAKMRRCAQKSFARRQPRNSYLGVGEGERETYVQVDLGPIKIWIYTNRACWRGLGRDRVCSYGSFSCATTLTQPTRDSHRNRFLIFKFRLKLPDALFGQSSC